MHTGRDPVVHDGDGGCRGVAGACGENLYSGQLTGIVDDRLGRRPRTTAAGEGHGRRHSLAVTRTRIRHRDAPQGRARKDGAGKSAAAGQGLQRAYLGGLNIQVAVIGAVTHDESRELVDTARACDLNVGQSVRRCAVQQIALSRSQVQHTIGHPQAAQAHSVPHDHGRVAVGLEGDAIRHGQRTSHHAKIQRPRAFLSGQREISAIDRQREAASDRSSSQRHAHGGGNKGASAADRQGIQGCNGNINILAGGTPTHAKGLQSHMSTGAGRNDVVGLGRRAVQQMSCGGLEDDGARPGGDGGEADVTRGLQGHIAHCGNRGSIIQAQLAGGHVQPQGLHTDVLRHHQVTTGNRQVQDLARRTHGVEGQASRRLDPGTASGDAEGIQGRNANVQGIGGKTDGGPTDRQATGAGDIGVGFRAAAVQDGAAGHQLDGSPADPGQAHAATGIDLAGTRGRESPIGRHAEGTGTHRHQGRGRLLQAVQGQITCARADFQGTRGGHGLHRGRLGEAKPHAARTRGGAGYRGGGQVDVAVGTGSADGSTGQVDLPRGSGSRDECRFGDGSIQDGTAGTAQMHVAAITGDGVQADIAGSRQHQVAIQLHAGIAALGEGTCAHPEIQGMQLGNAGETHVAQGLGEGGGRVGGQRANDRDTGNNHGLGVYIQRRGEIRRDHVESVGIPGYWRVRCSHIGRNGGNLGRFQPKGLGVGTDMLGLQRHRPGGGDDVGREVCCVIDIEDVAAGGHQGHRAAVGLDLPQQDVTGGGNGSGQGGPQQGSGLLHEPAALDIEEGGVGMDVALQEQVIRLHHHDEIGIHVDVGVGQDRVHGEGQVGRAACGINTTDLGYRHIDVPLPAGTNDGGGQVEETLGGNIGWCLECCGIRDLAGAAGQADDLRGVHIAGARDAGNTDACRRGQGDIAQGGQYRTVFHVQASGQGGERNRSSVEAGGGTKFQIGAGRREVQAPGDTDLIQLDQRTGPGGNADPGILADGNPVDGCGIDVQRIAVGADGLRSQGECAGPQVGRLNTARRVKAIQQGTARSIDGQAAGCDEAGDQERSGVAGGCRQAQILSGGKAGKAHAVAGGLAVQLHGEGSGCSQAADAAGHHVQVSLVREDAIICREGTQRDGEVATTGGQIQRAGRDHVGRFAGKIIRDRAMATDDAYIPRTAIHVAQGNGAVNRNIHAARGQGHQTQGARFTHQLEFTRRAGCIQHGRLMQGQVNNASRRRRRNGRQMSRRHIKIFRCGSNARRRHAERAAAGDDVGHFLGTTRDQGRQGVHQVAACRDAHGTGTADQLG